MQVPKLAAGIQPTITVILDNDPRFSRSRKAFHCLVCGKVCFEYYTNVKIVLPGEREPDTSAAPLAIQCHGRVDVMRGGDYRATTCKTKYWVE